MSTEDMALQCLSGLLVDEETYIPGDIDPVLALLVTFSGNLIYHREAARQ